MHALTQLELPVKNGWSNTLAHVSFNFKNLTLSRFTANVDISKCFLNVISKLENQKLCINIPKKAFGDKKK